ncbi:sigma-54 dependent transcriptional regulator [bacterium]|nr:sigma-54 dependent transcriptional regulator [bacterium]
MRKRILVVDDEPLIGSSLQEALGKWDYEATIIDEGERALDHLMDHSYDMVLTDIRMPNVSGMEILEKVKENFPATAVVMITAYGTIDQAVDAVKKGAYDYITKPFSLEALKLRLEKYFRSQELEQENQNLRKAVQEKYALNGFVGQNKKIKELFETLEIAIESDATAFIQSENGTGKELIASAIHYNGPRSSKPFIKINCASIPENLIESQLFGHEKGAFTGAIRKFKGVFEEADRGTLLLDEVTEMPTHLQAKLLRVLQEGEFSRVGSTQVLKTDVRVIATSNCNVQQAVDEGRFRQDLFFRLNVISLSIPALRERRDDIPLLCEHFIKKYAEKYSKDVQGVDEDVLTHFYNYSWPGNVRELENAIQRGVLSCRDRAQIGLEHLMGCWPARNTAEETHSVPSEDLTIDEMEKRLIASTLKRHNNHKTRTAEILGITLKTLRSKILQYGLEESSAPDVRIVAKP